MSTSYHHKSRIDDRKIIKLRSKTVSVKRATKPNQTINKHMIFKLRMENEMKWEKMKRKKPPNIYLTKQIKIYTILALFLIYILFVVIAAWYNHRFWVKFFAGVKKPPKTTHNDSNHLDSFSFVSYHVCLDICVSMCGVVAFSIFGCAVCCWLCIHYYFRFFFRLYKNNQRILRIRKHKHMISYCMFFYQIYRKKFRFVFVFDFADFRFRFLFVFVFFCFHLCFGLIFVVFVMCK